jgi:cephalosporin-C deacetylase
MMIDTKEYFKGLVNESKDFPNEMAKDYRSDLSDKNSNVYRISFVSAKNIQISGWLVTPTIKNYRGAIIQFPAYAQVLFPLLDFSQFGLVSMSVSVRGHHGSNQIVNPGFPGLLVHGLPHPDSYIYRDIFIDALRGLYVLLEFLKDEVPVIALGKSQGAALSLLLSAFCDEITAVAAEVPWLCSIKDSVGNTNSFPYLELKNYLRDNPALEEEVWSTLNLFDVYHHCTQIKCPVLFGLGTKDPVSPIEATRMLVSGIAQVQSYEYKGAGHEGGGMVHRKIQSEWVRNIIAKHGKKITKYHNGYS